MDLTAAKMLLQRSLRDELVDHTFGDAEIYWLNQAGVEVAVGYFGNTGHHVSIGSTRFEGHDADVLRNCGTLRHYARNDEGGSYFND